MATHFAQQQLGPCPLQDGPTMQPAKTARKKGCQNPAAKVTADWEGRKSRPGWVWGRRLSEDQEEKGFIGGGYKGVAKMGPQTQVLKRLSISKPQATLQEAPQPQVSPIAHTQAGPSQGLQTNRHRAVATGASCRAKARCLLCQALPPAPQSSPQVSKLGPTAAEHHHRPLPSRSHIAHSRAP